MLDGMTTQRIKGADGQWRSAEVPERLADLVRALNVAHVDVADARGDTITLADGRVLFVKFGFRAGGAVPCGGGYC